VKVVSPLIGTTCKVYVTDVTTANQGVSVITKKKNRYEVFEASIWIREVKEKATRCDPCE